MKASSFGIFGAGAEGRQYDQDNGKADACKRQNAKHLFREPIDF
jgi:hypothetical protein